MPDDRIYVIHSGSTIESLYTLFPLLVSRYNHMLVYLHVDSREARMACGGCVILVRVFKGDRSYATDNQKKTAFIKDFRKRFDRVIMLDDGAGSDSLHFEYMELVDLYYKGKLLRNRENYLRPMYGRQLFTDYYHEKYNLIDKHEKIREAPSNRDVLNKLRVSWNLGYGMYPIPARNMVGLAKAVTKIGFTKLLRPWFLYSYKKLIKTLNTPVNLGTKFNKVQARFGNNTLPETIGFQRRLFLDKCNGSKVVLSGTVKPKLYNSEIKTVSSVLSLFGWGEVCFRDFETVLNGALLIKPDMSHLETWPDIYVNSKTYLPVDWDGNGIADIIHNVSQNISQYTGIVDGGRTAYRNALLQLDNRVAGFLNEATAKQPGIAEYDSSDLKQLVS
jgi:hypothetical protein